MGTGEKIDVFIFNYNGINTVFSTIESLQNMKGVNVSINVIDDQSTDGSLEMIHKCFPNVCIHHMPYNTKKLNLLRNKALELAQSDFLFITDNDIKFDPNCLSELLKVMESDNRIATCNPRLMHWDKPEKIYAAGVKVHYIGAAISEQRDKSYDPNDIYPSVNSGGGISLIRREAAINVGRFDDNLMMGWGDDGEFYQRLLRSGYLCKYVPTAFALHENKVTDTLRKYRVVGQIFNRWFFIFSHYSLLLIFLLIPVFILYEFFQILFVLSKGVFPQYIEGNFLTLKHVRELKRKRTQVQELKTVSDKDVMYSGTLYISSGLIQKHNFIKFSVNTFSSILNSYWLLIKRIIP